MIIIAIVISGCANPPKTSIRQSSEFYNRNVDIKTIALMPPEVAVELQVFSGENESVPQEEIRISKLLKSKLTSYLKVRGFNTIDPNFEAMIENDEDLSFELTQLKEARNSAMETVYASALMPIEKSKNINQSLGAAVNQFASVANADALLFAKYSGYKLSAGSQTADIAKGVLFAVLIGSDQINTTPPRAGVLQLVLVDGRTGKVLWSNVARSFEFTERDISMVLDDFSKANPSTGYWSQSPIPVSQ